MTASTSPDRSRNVFEDFCIEMQRREEEVRERAQQALQQVGMSACEDRSPHYLSEGEKKRVAIATVLSMAPDVLVLDEPTVFYPTFPSWPHMALPRRWELRSRLGMIGILPANSAEMAIG